MVLKNVYTNKYILQTVNSKYKSEERFSFPCRKTSSAETKRSVRLSIRHFSGCVALDTRFLGLFVVVPAHGIAIGVAIGVVVDTHHGLLFLHSRSSVLPTRRRLPPLGDRPVIILIALVTIAIPGDRATATFLHRFVIIFDVFRRRRHATSFGWFFDVFAVVSLPLLPPFTVGLIVDPVERTSD